MKGLENEGKLVMFNSVKRMLEDKTIPVNDNLMSIVQQAGDFFDKVVEDMYSVKERERPYTFNVDNLRKMLEFAGYSFGELDYQQTPEIERAIKDFRSYAIRLKELEDNPRRFFSDDSRIEQVYEICGIMKNFYLRVVNEEDFHELQTPDD